MADILVGTCSWTDPALMASGWYPAGRRDAEGRLRHYATRFPIVEVDSTYYGMPSRRNSTLWAQRTPPGFRFDVKAFSLLTGHPTRTAALPTDLRQPGDPSRVRADSGLLREVWLRFSSALEPLRTSGRLGALLFQFPPWLAPGPRGEQLVEECTRRAEGWPVAVEFRHPEWWSTERQAATARFLGSRGMAAVAVDTVQGLPASIPPIAAVTTPYLAVVRFHGRSTSWGSTAPGSKEESYRHAYTEAELAPWVSRVREMSRRAGVVHVLFNNCCADASVRAAEAMRNALETDPSCTLRGPGWQRRA